MSVGIDFTLQPNTIQEKLEQLLQDNHDTINTLLEQPELNWANLMTPLEELDDKLSHFWSPISHLNSVMNNDELRDAYNACLPLLSQYATALAHNKKLFAATQEIGKTELNSVQQKVIDNELRDFKLAGVALNEQDKARFAELTQQLSQTQSKFEENIIDATDNWHYSCSDEAELSGIPEYSLAAAKQRAETAGECGWRFDLSIPTYLSIMQHADNAELRERFYEAYNTRASDQGPHDIAQDNSHVMQEILCKRLELAQLLGFNNYAEYSLSTKMAHSTKEVLDFLHQLITACKSKGEQEFKQLSAFATDSGHQGELRASDIAYYSEKMRQAQYAISEQELRPYFPAPQVLEGLFNTVERLFGIRLQAADLPVYRDDVLSFKVLDKNDNVRAYCYFDLYARAKKRGGAWMDDGQNRRVCADGNTQIPIALITCNFNAPLDGKPSLLSHDEVITLFHEFGHATQHMLTLIDYPEVSGINGVPWDAVEVASQFLENWAWQQESLCGFAKHVDSGDVLPDELYQKLWNARNFQAAMFLLRQLEFALFDFRLHCEFNPTEENQIQNILNEVREQVRVTPCPEYVRFQNAFSHIFAGGYAAGYYSYLWAEVMAADGFGAFLENGLFDQDTAMKWLHCILETGGSEDPAVLFERFRGRPAEINALLQQRGVS